MRTSESPLFQDRVDAGRRLGAHLVAHLHDRFAELLDEPLDGDLDGDLDEHPDGNPGVVDIPKPHGGPVVIGLPRGGVPVAAQVANALHADLDVVVVRKLGAPGHPELAIGAIGEGGARVLNAELIRRLGITPAELAAVERAERSVLEGRVRELRSRHTKVSLADRSVILVDDGLATGATARAAIRAVRADGARHVVIAVPVAPPYWPHTGEVDQFVALASPKEFTSVGQHYVDFSQTTESEVHEILDRAARRGDS